MAKFVLSETYPVFVTWTKVIEANTLDEARNIFDEGGGTSNEPIMGGILEGSVIEFEAHMADCPKYLCGETDTDCDCVKEKSNG